MGRLRAALAAAFAACLLLPAVAVAQGSGSGSGQDTSQGDVFGDLVHILRDAETGQPILQKRWVALQTDVFDWAYCPVPVDINGAEIPFAPDSCDVDPAQAARLVPVDYFGRLSGGRTKERNLRMHFDETIGNIQLAEAVDLEPAGRLMLGTGCAPDGTCATWKVVDSPMENLALYHRLMKYGHLQTDPAEVDTSSGGDPALGTVYHPALRAEDWAKFRPALAALLPEASAGECFTGTSFVATCAQPRPLDAEDFVRAASFLGGASDKTGRTTVDLVQFMNRILKITQTTPDSVATLNTLPVLIRDENGFISPAIPGMPAPADERLVNFSSAAYWRDERFNKTTPGLTRLGPGEWGEHPALPILPYLVYSNGDASHDTNITAFVHNASDAQRAIEFIHNYEIPLDLMVTPPPPTPDTTAPTTSITYPLSGATVSGAITIQAFASDDVSLVGVRIQLDGVDLGPEMTVEPFTAAWDTTLAANGSTHVIRSIARDAAGNIGTSGDVLVTVSNLVSVPNVVGTTQAAATSTLSAAGLSVGTISTQNNAAPAGTIIAQDPAGGTLVAPGSAVALTVSLGPALVSVPAVVGLTQAAAEAAIVGAGLTVGTVTTQTGSEPAGTVVSQNPVGGLSVAPGTAVALVVSLGETTPVIAATVYSDGQGTRTTPAFSTTVPGAVLVAFVASDGPPATNSQSVTVSGAGLTWTRVQRAAMRWGDSEIWTATAPAALTNVTVRSVQSAANFFQSLTVVAFTGVSGIGASTIAGAASGAPTISVAAQAAGSFMFAVGNDWDNAVPRTIPAGQTKVHEYMPWVGDTFWVQRLDAFTAAAGQNVTLNATAPTNDQWNMAIVEIKR